MNASVSGLKKKLKPLVVAARNMAMGSILGLCRGPRPYIDRDAFNSNTDSAVDVASDTAADSGVASDASASP